MYNPWPVSVVSDHPEGHVLADGSRQESCNLAGNKSVCLTPPTEERQHDGRPAAGAHPEEGQPRGAPREAEGAAGPLPRLLPPGGREEGAALPLRG